MDNQAILKTVVTAADDRRAHNIEVLNIEKLSIVGRYFVIMDASSSRQVKAIADHVIDELAIQKIKVEHLEGKDQSKWILLDLGDVLVHIFTTETREFYKLEKLWADATNEDISAWVTED
ncbi:ribosome silencing factor [Fructilactobacillus florum]|nr:ribosome silencing factor [Fructilactobacillus florum]